MPASKAIPAASAELTVARELLGIAFDRFSTPRVKLPNCPVCDEDELCCPFPNARWRRWMCLRCSWSFEHTRVTDAR